MVWGSCLELWAEFCAGFEFAVWPYLICVHYGLESVGFRAEGLGHTPHPAGNWECV